LSFCRKGSAFELCAKMIYFFQVCKFGEDKLDPLHMPMNLPLKDRFTTFLRCIPAVLLLCNAFLGYYLHKYVYFFVLPLRWWCWILQDRQRVMDILLLQHEIFMMKNIFTIIILHIHPKWLHIYPWTLSSHWKSGVIVSSTLKTVPVIGWTYAARLSLGNWWMNLWSCIWVVQICCCVSLVYIQNMQCNSESLQYNRELFSQTSLLFLSYG